MSSSKLKDLTSLEKILRIKFKNKKLLHEALTHRSYINEHPSHPIPHNERLEFLGDAVLELIISKSLFHKFTAKPEGELTVLRSSLVNTDSLTKVADELQIDRHLYLSKGETKSKGKAREVILANTIEAIIGAIYLDQGFVAAEKFIKKNFLSRLGLIIKYKLYKDPKSDFQEITQAQFKITPAYKVLQETGPEHAKKFTVGVFLGDKMIAVGSGKSKQEAEIDAAKNALQSKNIAPT